MLVASDVYSDPQALILSPGNVIRISKELVKGDSYVANARNGALAALNIIEETLASGSMTLPEMETSWHRSCGTNYPAYLITKAILWK